MNTQLRISLLILPVIAVLIIAIASRTGPTGSTPEGIGGIEVFRSTSTPAFVVEEVSRDLEIPWSIEWTSHSRMLVAERPGRILAIEEAGSASPTTLWRPEWGENEILSVMGMVLDPNYEDSRAIYVCVLRLKFGTPVDSIMRLIDRGHSIVLDRILIDDIPAGPVGKYGHSGCRLVFGPDGKLYATTGDAGARELAQDVQSLAGKVLRINSDGTIPEDNPFPNSPVWSYGHRNPQGIAFHPQSGELYITEHGPSEGYDGPPGGDEVNRIVRGGNYGWPLVSHEARLEGTAAPLLVFTPAEAPASGMFYSGSRFPGWKNNLFFGALKGEGIVRVVIDDGDPGKAIFGEKILGGQLGRIRAITEAPDGYIYFSTSNRDGVGTPRFGDDKIYRIVPE